MQAIELGKEAREKGNGILTQLPSCSADRNYADPVKIRYYHLAASQFNSFRSFAVVQRFTKVIGAQHSHPCEDPFVTRIRNDIFT